jgi:DtxR family Mn-dependent transcriptional regulator
MIDPGPALLVFAALALLSWVIFRPERGLWAKLRDARIRRSDRVREEDALKHLYMVERQERAVSVEGLAEELGLTPPVVEAVLARLEERDWVSDGRSPSLTDLGRDRAVQTLRTHRLWERWLADRTGVRAERWHDEAERMEHALSPGEVDALANRLGNPRYDPHGDPIPTAAGELPPPAGVPLADAPPGRVVEITHLEDEPPEVFRGLLEADMAVGLTVSVRGRTPSGVELDTPYGDRRLDPAAADHVTVRLLPPDAEVEPRRRSLDQVATGERVRVAGIAPACQGPQRRRLLDLGVVPGTEITPELASASRDPVAYRIRGALIALRRDQARWINVDDEVAEEAPSGEGAR